jgi:MFS family permease
MSDSAANTPAWRSTLLQLPKGVWALGFAAMFMDVSSELVHSLLPVFMSAVLGASMLTIGLVEGIAEATASITKVFSGALSDYWGKRKPLVVFGYGLSAVTKPMFPMAASIGWVAVARFVDRVGKGVRGAPRDALVADITPANTRGAAYGLRQALDSIGAFLGPLLAVVLMALLRSNIRAVLWAAALPALAAIVLVIAAVREPEHDDAARSVQHTAIRIRDARSLGRNYWLIVALGAVFTLARFSEAFLVLRAQYAGLGVAYVPIVMIVMNAVYTAAYPAGAASDRMSHRKLLLGGLGVLIASDLILASASSVGLVLAGAAFWGLHMALTQGLFSKLVADTAPAELRGTAFGVFNLFAGVSALLASAIAGALWNSLGPSATFLTGAAFATITAVGLIAQGTTE